MCPWEFFRSYRYTLLLVVPSWNDSVSDTLRDPAGFASILIWDQEHLRRNLRWNGTTVDANLKIRW